MHVIGLDAASQPENFGYAVGVVEGQAIKLLQRGHLGRTGRSTGGEALLAAYIRKHPSGIVAIDAPMGWPKLMGAALSAHNAGEYVAVSKDDLFRRKTELMLRTAKIAYPLEVGADKIARASHEALRVLHSLRQHSGCEIPLASSQVSSGWAAIEVYPAATLTAHGAQATKYKEPEHLEARRAIAQRFVSTLPGMVELVHQKSDVFDACICLVAALDYLMGDAIGPTKDQAADAVKEGWIWVRGDRGDATNQDHGQTLQRARNS